MTAPANDAGLERRRRADLLFTELAELAASERRGRLDEIAREDRELALLVERLLAALAASGATLTPLERVAAVAHVVTPLAERVAPERDDPPEGSRFGAWQIVAPLGRGGMSRVYVAERAEGGFRQRAALKLFDAGPGSGEELARRFEQERHLVAALEHPNIARVLDGGVGENGRSFLVLELVDGEPIDVWCAKRSLGLRERVALVVAAARAVQHAHGNLVVHRDLKPSNLLVTREGQVKLLDFGIAKVLSGSSALAGLKFTAPETRTLSRPLTPAYASPEQVRGGAVTTASDVYQLGLLLYELLAGRPAHQFREDGWRELERVVCDVDPPRLWRTSPGVATAAASGGAPLRRVPADLETIVFKAMDKEPQRRYASAEQLAEDLERFLADQPVLARADTLVYRARKFARRHRLAVSAVLALAAAIGAGSAATFWQWREAARQRDVARREAERSERALAYLLDVFETADEGGGAAVTARELVARSADRLRRGDGQGADRAEMLEILARADSALGLHGDAAALRGELVDTVRDRHGGESLEAARALAALGNSLVLAGDFSRAIDRLEESLRLERRYLGDDHPDVLTTSTLLSYALGVKGDVRRSLALREHVLAERTRLQGPEDPAVAQALNDVGRSLRFLGRLDEAEQRLREAIALRRRLDGEAAPSAGIPLSNLALVLADRGALPEADAAAGEALALAERGVRPGHPSLAGRIQLLGTVRLAQGRLDEAGERFEFALALYRASLPAEHFSIAEAELALAETRLLEGRREEALALAETAYERLGRSFPQRGFRAGQAAALLGACRAVTGGGADALALAAQGYEAIVAELGEASPIAVRALQSVERAKAEIRGARPWTPLHASASP